MAKNFLEMTTEEREYALDCANTFLEWTREDIKDVTKSFFKIGFRLYEARAYKYYEALGYPDIETLAEEEFGFKRSTTYGLIQVYEKTCTEYGHNSMDEKYIEYDYSKLLELCRQRYGGDEILAYIKPTDSVRDIRKYITYWNEYSQKHSVCPSITLQEWKAQQAQTPVLPAPETTSKQIEGQMTFDELRERTREQAHAAGIPFYDGEMTEDFNPYVYDGNMSVEDYELMHKHMEEAKKTEEDFDTWLEKQPEGTFVQGGGLDSDYKPTAPVQTSGLQPYAEAETEPTAEPEKPKYNFSVRAGVREFLNDYRNWEWFKSPTSCFFLRVWTYTFKNGAYIYACERHIYEGATLQLGKAKSQIMYFLNAWSNDGIAEISKNQFEQYCAEHKDEL